MPDAEWRLRTDRGFVTRPASASGDALLALARAHVVWTEANLGALAGAVDRGQRARDRAVGGWPARRGGCANRRGASLAVAERAPVGATSSLAIRERADLAATLMDLGRVDEARGEFVAVLAASEHNEGVRRSRASALENLALADEHLGHFDSAVDLFERSLDEYAATFGRDSPQALGTRAKLVSLAVDLGRLDLAQRHLDLLVDAYRRKSDA